MRDMNNFGRDPRLLVEDLHKTVRLSAIPKPAEFLLIFGTCLEATGDLLWGDGACAFPWIGSRERGLTDRRAFLLPGRPVRPAGCRGLDVGRPCCQVRQIVTTYSPAGLVVDAPATFGPTLANEGVVLTQVRRRWDEKFWPHATKGSFSFKERIPTLVREESLQ